MHIRQVYKGIFIGVMLTKVMAGQIIEVAFAQ